MKLKNVLFVVIREALTYPISVRANCTCNINKKKGYGNVLCKKAFSTFTKAQHD